MNPTTPGEETEKAKSNGRRPEPGERERVLAEWAVNGKRAEEMAALSGWSIHTLYRWRNEAGQGKRSRSVKGPPLVAVPKPKPAGPTAGTWAAEVTISGASVRLSIGCPVGWIGQLVRELRSC